MMKCLQDDLISVIIPAYNCATTISRTIQSVCQQTYENIEILIIDDGSTDSTSTICESLSANDNRIKVFHCNNNGVATARNIGISWAKGKYITFIDSDDFMNRRMIEILHTFSLDNCLDIATCNFERVNGSTKTINGKGCASFVVDGEQSLKRIIDSSVVEAYIWNKMFRAEIIKHQSIPKEITLCEDLYILVKICSERNIKLGYTPEVLYSYTVTDNGLSHNPRNTLIGNQSKYATVFQKIKDTCKLNQNIKERLDIRCFRILLSQVYNLSYNEYQVDMKGILQELKTYFCLFLKSNESIVTKFQFSIKYIRVHFRLLELRRKLWKKQH